MTLFNELKIIVLLDGSKWSFVCLTLFSCSGAGFLHANACLLAASFLFLCTGCWLYLPPPPAVHLQKLALIVDPLCTCGGYISRYTVFKLTLVIKHYLEQKIFFIVGPICWIRVANKMMVFQPKSFVPQAQKYVTLSATTHPSRKG